MDAIAERGRAAMQWLLVLGLAAAWAMFDRSPRVVEEARRLVDGCLVAPEGLGLEGDPLTGLPADTEMLFRQYRHEHLRFGLTLDASQRAERRQSLQPVTIGATIAFGKHVLAQVDASPVPGVRETLVVAPLRQSVARLEAWQTQCPLGPSASLLQVEAELRSRVPIPGTEQSIPVEQCMGFVGVGLVGLQLFLTSLLATLRALPVEAQADRSWVVLHRGLLGALLAAAWLVLPSWCWIGQEFARAANEDRWPPWGSWAIGLLLVVTALTTLSQMRLVRRLWLAAPIATSKIVPTRRQAA